MQKACFLVAAHLWLWVGVSTGQLIADPLPPGVLSLSGSWQMGLDGESPWDVVTKDVQLPATWEELGLQGFEGTVILEREVETAVEQVSAPSGLGVLIDAARFGYYELRVSDQIAGESGANLISLPRSRVFALPEKVVGQSPIRIELRFRRVSWASDRAQSGPVGERILLGNLDTLALLTELDGSRDRQRALLALLFAALLAAVGGYHLQLFSRRRERREYLWFGLTALDFAAIVLLARLGSSLTGSYLLGRRLTEIALHLLVFLLIQLLWPYLNRSLGGLEYRYQMSHLVIAGALVIAPSEWLVRTSEIRWLWTLPFFVSLLVLLLKQPWRRDSDVRTIGLGALALIGTGVVELVLQVTAQGTSFPAPAWAFAFFALLMSISLSNRYSRLHLELDQMRYQLEQKVEDATAELSTANRRLQAENSERQLAEESMRMLERAVEQSVDGIVVADLSGATEFLNEAWARMHGYEVPEVLGYDLNLFHTRQQMQKEVYPLLKQVRDSESFDGEVGHRHRDGTSFPTWMTANLVRDAEGEAVGIVAIARDLTRRRKAEEEQHQLEVKLQQSARLESLADFAAGIAHDYNNLLTGMIVHADLALGEVAPNTPAFEKIKQIERTAERAADLSDQLLAFAGEEEPALETLDLNELLANMEPQLRERITPKTVLQFQLKKELPPIDADAAQLRRIVLRLVANATDAIGGQEGVLTLRTSQVSADRKYFKTARPNTDLAPGPYVFFEVSDSGVGIDDETRQRIFDPFFSTKSSRRGLGLAAVLGIVGSHGGAIRVYSQPGRGTTFEVLFPASDKRRLVAKPKASEIWQAAGKVLIVDDEELVLEVSREILESRGFVAITAAGGKQALEIFVQQEDEIDAVVLDMTMPEMDGEEVFRRIRQLHPTIPIIMMSGYSRQKVSSRLVELGLGGFLHKPFRPQELMDKLQEVMET